MAFNLSPFFVLAQKAGDEKKSILFLKSTKNNTFILNLTHFYSLFSAFVPYNVP